MPNRHHPFYRYVALGDSLTAGIGSDLFSPDFVDRYAGKASALLQKRVIIDKFARSGATSGEILASLDIPVICETLKASDIVTLTAGGNDLIDAAELFLIDQNEDRLFNALESAIITIKKIMERIHDLHHPKHNRYIMRILNLYNPFPNIPQAEPWLQKFNSHLNEYARYPHIEVADIYGAFNGKQRELLRGIHPNDQGYEVMAEVVHRLGYAPLI